MFLQEQICSRETFSLVLQLVLEIRTEDNGIRAKQTGKYRSSERNKKTGRSKLNSVWYKITKLGEPYEI